MSERPPVVTLEGVTVVYGAQRALQDVTARFEAGAVGLLGPNGAGKSTMIKALLGFVVPAAGKMHVLGYDVAVSPLDIRARVGYMPESDAHIPGMNAVAFVAYCGELAGLPRVDAMQRAHEVLFYVGLGEARYRNVETYSTGMKQRIKLAQALVHDPDLLFLDEPTNGMDPKGRDEMLALVRDLAHRKGVNVIVSSHLLPDVEYTCDHVIVMDKGRVATEGPIACLEAAARPCLRAAGEGRRRDRSRFSSVLRTAGLECHETEEDVMRVFVPGDGGARDIFRLAAGCGRAGASPAAERADARGRVRARGGGAVGSAMPIHDQGYRRYGGERAAHGRAWAVIASAGIRTMLRKRAFLGLLLLAWLAVLRPRRPDLRGRESAAGGVPGADPRDVPRFPRLSRRLRVLHRRLRRFGTHRDRSARQRAADLPVEAAVARRVRLRQAGRAAGVPAARHLGAGDRAADRAGDVRRRLHVLRRQHLPVPGDHAVSAFIQTLTVSATMLALSSLSKSSRYVGILYAGVIFFTQAMYGVLYAGHARHELGVGVVQRQPEPDATRSSSACGPPTPRRGRCRWPVLAAVVALSAVILERRVRGVEVVA